jgi:large subunit ribosomal protein L23
MNPVALVPRISEKAIALAETGRYVFEVPTSANKVEVAKTVASTFNVQVVAVNMLITKGKPVSRRYGKHAGNRTNLKKAIVTLKAGQTISLFDEGNDKADKKAKVKK